MNNFSRTYLFTKEKYTKTKFIKPPQVIKRKLLKVNKGINVPFSK